MNHPPLQARHLKIFNKNYAIGCHPELVLGSPFLDSEPSSEWQDWNGRNYHKGLPPTQILQERNHWSLSGWDQGKGHGPTCRGKGERGIDSIPVQEIGCFTVFYRNIERQSLPRKDIKGFRNIRSGMVGQITNDPLKSNASTKTGCVGLSQNVVLRRQPKNLNFIRCSNFIDSLLCSEMTKGMLDG